MDPEAWLAQLEPVGWRFGLERIRALVQALGLPQHRFASVHVVGTNGKSSTAALASSLLEARGIRTGTYLSPHERRWAERIRLSGAEVGEDALAAAAGEVAAATETVNRTLAEGEAVTQFEAATALAFVVFAGARVDVAVVEAGLGGRLDATNVLPSRVSALTSVGLEHTEYLGETELEIAGEKLAVLRDHSTLVVGAVSPQVGNLAQEVAAERHARVIDASRPLDAAGLGGRAPYLSRNLAVAVAAAEIITGPLDVEVIERAAAATALPGRMEQIGGDPPTVLDSAHNPDGMRAVAEAIVLVGAGRPVVACLAIVSGKDAPAMMAALAPVVEAIVCTELPAERLEGSGRPHTESIPARDLARLAGPAGIGRVETEPAPGAAVATARQLARARGGVVLLTGSHYLLSYGS